MIRRVRTVAWLVVGALLLTVGIACRQGDPAIDPKTPPNSPLPKIERPDDPVVTPVPKKDGG